MTVLKHSSIVVRVEEALADLLVVSYRPHDATALYQGVLLHSNKTNLPYGVHSLHPAFLPREQGGGGGDQLHSVSQRFTYQQSQHAPAAALVRPKPRQKMTVRLRPRKVLCSKCRGICNENSENVNTSAQLQAAAAAAVAPSASDDEKKFLRGHSLIPKLARLQPSEISAATRARCSLPASAAPGAAPAATADVERPPFSSARTLKICFGEGEGTVVTIPAVAGEPNEDSGVSSDVARADCGGDGGDGGGGGSGSGGGGDDDGDGDGDDDSRAAKRALKRARRQARRHKGKRKKRRRLERDENEGDGSGRDGEEAPEFPAAAAGEAAACEAGGGGGAAPGDVVWGKLAGFPWWPARVLAAGADRAHVAWYASATSSHVQLAHLTPFLPLYNIRFNKKKRGAYREAVRLATADARRAQPSSPSPLSPRPQDLYS